MRKYKALQRAILISISEQTKELFVFPIQAFPKSISGRKKNDRLVDGYAFISLQYYSVLR